MGTQGALYASAQSADDGLLSCRGDRYRCRWREWMLGELSRKRGGTAGAAIGEPAGGECLSNRRRLDPAEREVVRPLGLRDRQRRDWSATWCLRGECRERRPSGIWSAEETCNLVEGLTRRIVNRAAEALHGPITFNPHKQRVSTRDDKPDRRERRFIYLCRLA
jgi:hypothetical protein